MWKKFKITAPYPASPPPQARWQGGAQGSRKCYGSALVSMRIRVRSQHFLSMRIRIRIQSQIFDDQNWKNLQLKKIFFDRPLLRTFKLQEKSSALKREHLALKNLNFLHFCGSVWPSWIQIRIPIADPIRVQPTKINAHPCGSGSSMQQWFQDSENLSFRTNANVALLVIRYCVSYSTFTDNSFTSINGTNVYLYCTINI